MKTSLVGWGWSMVLVAAAACGDDGVTGGSGGSGASAGSDAGGGGAGAGGGEGGGGGDPAPVCAEQHDAATGDGFDVIVCDVAFEDGPAVHLPAAFAPDNDPTSEIVYAFIQGADFVTPDGRHFPHGLSLSELDGELVRYAFTFYRVLVDASDTVVAFTPFVVVDESLLIGRFVGLSAEGFISPRVAEGEFDLDPTLPIRVRFDAIGPLDDITVLPPSVRKQLTLVIENLNDGVVAADDSCLEPLGSFGDQNPFFGATTAEISAALVPSMHGAGDDHFVLSYVIDGSERGSTMGPAWFIPIGSLVSEEPVELGPYTGAPHGNPTSIPGIELTIVDDSGNNGGEPCNAL